MRVRVPVAVAAVALLAPAAAAQAQPNSFLLTTSVRPHQAATLVIGTVPKGEFAFNVRVSSDGAKKFRLTQQRNGGTRFTVLDGAALPAGACQGAAGTLGCSGITTPATPGGKRWTFTFTNRSSRPQELRLSIRWRPVTSAG